MDLETEKFKFYLDECYLQIRFLRDTPNTPDGKEAKYEEANKDIFRKIK